MANSDESTEELSKAVIQTAGETRQMPSPHRVQQTPEPLRATIR